MSYSEKEVKEQEKQIAIVGKIFLSILLLTIVGNYFMTNSKSYIDRKYHEFQNYSFSGEIYKKTQDQNGTGCNIARYLHLKTGTIHRVNYLIYTDLEIGDFVFKIIKSDTINYVKKNGDTIKQNENPYYEKYIELIKKQNH
jgi:hypothetical protein